MSRTNDTFRNFNSSVTAGELTTASLSEDDTTKGSGSNDFEMLYNGNKKKIIEEIWDGLINYGFSKEQTAAILGISAVIAGSAELFAVLKWAGAAYLFYLGLRSLLASRRHESHEDGAPIEAAAAALQNAEAETPAAAFRSGLFCNLLNPKVVLFVLTFFPQFMDAALPAGPQLALMGVTWAFLGLAWLAVLVVMMDRIRPVFGRPAFQRWLNRTMSVILILFGLRLAAARS